MVVGATLQQGTPCLQAMQQGRTAMQSAQHLAVGGQPRAAAQCAAGGANAAAAEVQTMAFLQQLLASS